MLTSCGLRGISILSQLGCCGEVMPEVKHRLHVCVPVHSHCSDKSNMLSLPGIAMMKLLVLKSSIPAKAVKPLLVLLEVLTKRAPSCTDLLQNVI